MNEVPNAPSGNRWLRFSLSHLFLLTLVVGLILGWWFDRRRLAARNDLYQLQVERLTSSLDEARHSSGVVSAEKFSRFAAGGDFLEVLDPQVDWYEFQDELTLFAKSPAADRTVALLFQRLDDPSPEVRTRALASLGVFKLRPAEVIPAVTAKLRDPVPNAAWHAANTLGEFGPQAKSAASALSDIFHDDKSSIATHCGLMLHQIDPPAEIGPRLIELTHSPIRENRWRAVHALVDHVQPEVAQAVLPRLFESEQDKEIRTMIADALNRQSNAKK